MYIIYSESTSKIKKLYEYLSKKKDMLVYPTKDDCYLFTTTSPTRHLNGLGLGSGVTVKTFKGNFVPFIRKYDNKLMSEPIAKVKDKLCPGATASIVSGPYAGFSGIVKSYHAEGNYFKVEISVWGKIMMVDADEDDVEAVKTNL